MEITHFKDIKEARDYFWAEVKGMVPEEFSGGEEAFIYALMGIKSIRSLPPLVEDALSEVSQGLLFFYRSATIINKQLRGGH